MPQNGAETGVEIKVSFRGQQVARALDVLGPGGHSERRSIGFLEDSTVGMVLPLFHQGIVLRVRQIDGDADDATVKLRPCRRSQLGGSWLGATKGEGWRLTVEEDWAGNRRALAASCVSELPQGRIASVRAGTAPVRRLFSEGQERFLSDCAGTPINLDALTLLPPVAATRRSGLRVGGVRDVIAERWVIDDLDFLELSIRTDTVADARRAQEELDRELRALDLQQDDDSKSKTERVLTHLVGLGAVTA
jgi:hypothetical protein